MDTREDHQRMSDQFSIVNKGMHESKIDKLTG